MARSTYTVMSLSNANGVPDFERSIDKEQKTPKDIAKHGLESEANCKTDRV